MREPIKDLGRITHMLEMAEMLNSEKELCSLDRIKAEKLYFYGLSKMVEI